MPFLFIQNHQRPSVLARSASGSALAEGVVADRWRAAVGVEVHLAAHGRPGVGQGMGHLRAVETMKNGEKWWEINMKHRDFKRMGANLNVNAMGSWRFVVNHHEKHET